MKQQEILKKIGNILKELNEQYEYLQAEDAHINDLELELFAANAKFLTDHNEILRKINAQQQNAIPALPEHHEPEVFNIDASNQETGVEETILPPFSDSALNYQTDIIAETEHEEALNLEYQEISEAEQTQLFSYEEPVANKVETEYKPEQSAYEEPAQPEYVSSTDSKPEWPAQEEPHPPSFNHFNENEPEQHQEHSINIEPAHERESFDFTRHEPQVSEEQHTFELQSSYTEEEAPAPPHVDLTPVEPKEQTTETQKEETESEPETYESVLAKYGQPVNTTSVEPIAPEPTETFAEREVITPAQEEEPLVAPDNAWQPTAEEPKTFQTYIPPVEAEAPKPELEQPLSLHERLAAQLRGESAPAAQPQQQPPVTDIKAAINMNDRLLFVKDLFNGYGMAYNEAIELLNRYRSFDEADKFLKMNYVTKNHWEEKPGTVDKFYAILRRKFPN